MRGASQHGAALVHRRIPRAHRRADFRHEDPAISSQRPDFTKGNLQVGANVVAERLEGRNVQNFRAIH